MKTAQLEYDLPETLIAQHPCEQRDESRLLVVDRAAGEFKEDVFKNLGSYLDAGDCLVVNDTRVIRARLRGRKKTGGKVEIFLLKELKPGLWETLIRPSARVKPGMTVYIGDSICAEVENGVDGGRRRVRFSEPDVLGVLEARGEIPLPPYIHERLGEAERYQTVYSRVEGSIAAPTAGLHFTPGLLERVRSVGAETVFVTLHVGWDSFRPVKTEELSSHEMHSEYWELGREAADAINRAKREGRRVICAGTTATRLLEQAAASSVDTDGLLSEGTGWADLFILPGYRFQVVDALVTNFHLPRSTLLMLVSALAGRALILNAYREAVEHRYRFYSFGDAMLIL
ncbi:MAG: tRNA preQ1(34) S-adenosylmethionine ribosyltransferase-isomerase QueA [Chloroflexi bacterium]|nr:tRNA preQ1(34) S-adenosylmethionine ribosyltransferase-isomerase QueA [Chloroflexota bacterium]